jgi:hypothetical protein
MPRWRGLTNTFMAVASGVNGKRPWIMRGELRLEQADKPRTIRLFKRTNLLGLFENAIPRYS